MHRDAELRQKYLNHLGLSGDAQEVVWEKAQGMARGGQVSLSEAVGLALADYRNGNRLAVAKHGSKASEHHDSRRTSQVRRVRDRLRAEEG